MEKKIRQGMFETNSSSTHSICVAKNSKLDIPTKLRFYFGEYGWERDTLSSVGEKASYLYTGLIGCNRESDADKIIETLRGRGIEVTAEEAIYEHREYKKDNGDIEKWDYAANAGYVDHANDLSDFLNDICNDDEKLMEFLFSPLSFIITGNDNDDEDVSISVNYPHDEYYKGN